jgi:hypothetical protein
MDNAFGFHFHNHGAKLLLNASILSNGGQEVKGKSRCLSSVGLLGRYHFKKEHIGLEDFKKHVASSSLGAFAS